jgi:hypothetical protein
MTDVKVPASGNIRVWWALPNAFANYVAPTAAEINASLDLSDAISWNDFGFALNASNTIDDPAITALGKVSDRGAAQFGGAISFYYPGAFGDASNKYSLVYDALDQPRTSGFLVIRIDGENHSATASSNELVHVFKVMTDGYAETIVGEEAFRYTVTFLPQGDLAVRTLVASGTPTTVGIVEGVGTIMSAGDVLPLHAYLNETRIYTNGLKWTSSDPAAVSVSTAGVLTCHTTATTTITATYKATGATATFLVND